MHFPTKASIRTVRLFALITVTLVMGSRSLPAQTSKRPNILVVVSDDQSYPFASAYGKVNCLTPGFDRVAREGVLFHRAYATSPSCSPSRASILTGRLPWQNEEAGMHNSLFPAHLNTYPAELEKGGYLVGFTGKGWGPGKFLKRKENPAGKAYNELKNDIPLKNVSSTDYFGNFDLFLDLRKENQPFCFWFGAEEPQRPFDKDGYITSQHSPDEAFIPGFLPDHPIVRSDIMDYVAEIEWFDQHLFWMLQRLEEIGELNNTLIIVTSDNGMPFPRAKANCYDYGVHVPLAIAWKNNIPAGQTVELPVTLLDIAPTVMDAARVNTKNMTAMQGASLLPFLTNKAPKPPHSAVYASRERHASARIHNTGYPQRMIATEEYLFISNLHPERYPAGDPYVYRSSQIKKLLPAMFDIDESPTKTLLREQSIEPPIRPFYKAAAARRPAEELYHLSSDPFCMNNIINNPQHKQAAIQLRDQLNRYRRQTGDTRSVGSNPEVWETYPTFTETRLFPNID